MFPFLSGQGEPGATGAAGEQGFPGSAVNNNRLYFAWDFLYLYVYLYCIYMYIFCVYVYT